MMKNKIRILHVAQAAGGVDRYIRMLLKYLDKDRFENVLVCSQDFHREDYDGLVDSFEQIEMNRAIGVNDLKSIGKVRRLIKKYHPDIGTWYAVDETEIGGEKFFLLEHEEHGDMAACVAVNEQGKLVAEDLWNGFDDEFLDAVKEYLSEKWNMPNPDL